MAAGIRQIGRLRADDIRQGLSALADPESVKFLDLLGRTRRERVERMATMLRNSSQSDIDEMGVVFGLAMARAADQFPAPAARRHRPDPVELWASGVRKVAAFDPAEAWRGFENFARPSAGGMLDSMGRTRAERVEKMAGLLKTMSPADMEEMGLIYSEALARATGDAALSADRRPQRAERPSRRRDMSAAEWRRERRSRRDA